MDLGATLCTPRRPRCPECPWRERCAAFKSGDPEAYPRRVAKAEKPTRHGVVFWAEREDGAVLVRRRPSRGLLGGMMEFPPRHGAQLIGRATKRGLGGLLPNG